MKHSGSGFRLLPKNNSVKNINNIKGINSMFINFFSQNTKESPCLIGNIINKSEKDCFNVNKKIPIKNKPQKDIPKTQKSDFVRQYLSANKDKETPKSNNIKYSSSMEKRQKSSTNNMSANTVNNKTNNTSNFNQNVQSYNSENFPQNPPTYMNFYSSNNNQNIPKSQKANKRHGKINSLSVEDAYNDLEEINKLKKELLNYHNSSKTIRKKKSASIGRPLLITNNNYQSINDLNHLKPIHFESTSNINTNTTNTNLCTNIQSFGNIKVKGKVQKTFSYTQSLNNILKSNGNITNPNKGKTSYRGKTNTQRYKQKPIIETFPKGKNYFSPRCFSLNDERRPHRENVLSLSSGPSHYKGTKSTTILYNGNKKKNPQSKRENTINIHTSKGLSKEINNILNYPTQNTNYTSNIALNQYKNVEIKTVNEMAKAITMLKNRAKSIFDGYYNMAANNVKNN